MNVVTFRLARRGTAMLLAVLGGCAATRTIAPEAPPMQVEAAPVVLAGILVAVRPVLGGASRRSVLSALGAPDDGAGAAAVELIVLQDDGRTISVVQPDPGGLQAGRRVSVLPSGVHSGPTRISLFEASR